MQNELYIEVLEGPNKGQTIRIQEGVRIGRSRGEFKLDDPRVSSLHAQVVIHRRGVFVLQDRQSTNKIVFNGEKVDKLALLPGIKFRLGDTILTVRQQELTQTQALEPQSEPSLKELGWHEQVRRQVTSFVGGQKARESAGENVQLFESPVWVTVDQGLGAGTTWGLAWGPRRVGADQADIQLEEPSSPPVAFEIFFDDSLGLLFKTNYPAIVRFDDQPLAQSAISKTHFVQIGKTRLKVWSAPEDER